MKALRTPDHRFDDLPGFPFEPRYVEIDDTEGGRLRIHYVDAGPADGETVLLLHGEPTWSYMFRTMIPVLVAAGLRAVAPDLVGFGRSDKPAETSDYTYERHLTWMDSFVERIGLEGATVAGHDWGGIIGLQLAVRHPDRFVRIVASNHGFPTGDRAPTDAFLAWLEYSQTVDPFPVGSIVANACRTALPPEVVAAYDAPFPDESYKAGARIFPVLVPIRPDDPAAPTARRGLELLKAWERPFLTAFSDGDPVTAGADVMFQATVPGAKGQRHAVLAGGGHNLHEDVGAELGRVVADFIVANPR
ncbi:MAG: haloalkane dehalogenase [Actinomycetota bacterium]|jgi:haloalkane dehalogenase